MGELDTVTDFLIELGAHETVYASSNRNKHFCTKWCHRQTYQDYEQPPQTSQNSDFQSHFSVLKNTGLGDQLLIKNVFENFDFWNTLFSKNIPNFCQLCS